MKYVLQVWYNNILMGYIGVNNHTTVLDLASEFDYGDALDEKYSLEDSYAMYTVGGYSIIIVESTKLN